MIKFKNILIEGFYINYIPKNKIQIYTFIYIHIYIYIYIFDTKFPLCSLLIELEFKEKKTAALEMML